MSIAVLVPYRPGQPQRDRIWSLLSQAYWPSMSARVEVFVADSPAGQPFSRAAAVNQAALDAGDWEVAIIADADTFVSTANLRRALQSVVASRSTVLPFDYWRSITRETTAEIVASGVLDDRSDFPYDMIRPPVTAVSGSVVVHRSIWDEVGGMDEGFRQYGWEDRAFMRAAELAGSTQRIPGTAWHLHHRREQANPAALAPGRERYELYRQARDLTELKELLG